MRIGIYVPMDDYNHMHWEIFIPKARLDGTEPAGRAAEPLRSPVAAEHAAEHAPTGTAASASGDAGERLPDRLRGAEVLEELHGHPQRAPAGLRGDRDDGPDLRPRR